METSRFRIFGIPVHAIVNDIPASLMPVASICDLISVTTGKQSWATAGYHMLQVGNVGAVLAGTFGFMDYLNLPKENRVQKLGKAHMAMNGVLLPLFMYCMWRRRENPEKPDTVTMLLMLAANVGLAVSGSLGSKMVFEHGVAVKDAPAHGPTSREHRQSPLPEPELGAMHADGWDDNSEPPSADDTTSTPGAPAPNVTPMQGSLTGEHTKAA